MSEQPDIERIAYHEAGHAVTCVMLAVPFRYVTIIPKADALGHVRPGSTWSNPLKAMEGILADTPWRQVRREHMLMIYLAGQVAESIIYGQDETDDSAESDFTNVADIVLSEHMPGEEADSYIAYLWARTQNRLQMDPWRSHLETVKAALLDKGRLTGREVKALIFWR